VKRASVATLERRRAERGRLGVSVEDGSSSSLWRRGAVLIRVPESWPQPLVAVLAMVVLAALPARG